MIETPTFTGSIEFGHVLLAALTLGVGYVAHEVLHLVPFALFGDRVSISILPTREGQAKWQALLVGTVVEIAIPEPVPRWRVITSALAPGLLALPGLAVWAVLLQQPTIHYGVALVLGVYIAVTLPSPADWYTIATYRPEKVTAIRAPDWPGEQGQITVTQLVLIIGATVFFFIFFVAIGVVFF